MSYALSLTGDARPDLRQMEPWLQEETWDELDRLADDPSLLAEPNEGGVIEFQFDRVIDSTLFVVIVTLGRGDFSQTLTILGLRVVSGTI